MRAVLINFLDRHVRYCHERGIATGIGMKKLEMVSSVAKNAKAQPFSPLNPVVIDMGALPRAEGVADKARAYREAGRTAVAFELGIITQPKSISIVRSDEYLGRAHLVLRLANLVYDVPTDEMRLEAEKHAIVSLCGIAAQKKYLRYLVRNDVVSNDYGDAFGIMSYFFPETHELDAYVRFLILRAKNLVVHPQIWKRIEALAAVLVERHALSVEEAEQVMWDADV
jgi:hypothetical protein